MVAQATKIDVNLDLAHRSTTDDLFVQDYMRVSDHESKTLVRIPRNHPRLSPNCTRVPLTLALETIRQAGFVRAHETEEIPLDWHFVAERLGVRWISQAPQLDSFHGFKGLLVTRVSVDRRRPRTIHMTYDFDFLHNEQVVGHGFGTTICLDPDHYRALRRRSFSRVAEEHSDLKAEKTNSRRVTLDWENDKFFFRRPSDHVVSMAITDAFIRAAMRDIPEEHMRSIDMSFIHFAAAERPIYLDFGDPNSDPSLRGVFTQDQTVIAEGTISHI